MAATRLGLATAKGGMGQENMGHPSRAKRKGRLIFSRIDEESGSEMFFTEIETNETDAGTLLL